jgi:ribosomal protein L24
MKSFNSQLNEKAGNGINIYKPDDQGGYTLKDHDCAKAHPGKSHKAWAKEEDVVDAGDNIDTLPKGAVGGVREAQLPAGLGKLTKVGADMLRDKSKKEIPGTQPLSGREVRRNRTIKKRAKELTRGPEGRKWGGTSPAKGKYGWGKSDGSGHLTRMGTGAPGAHEEVEIVDESKVKFKVGDTVIAKTGPHKGDKHKVIHVFKDKDNYNVRPMGLTPRQIQYKLGAATAKGADLRLAEEVEMNIDERVSVDGRTRDYRGTVKRLETSGRRNGEGIDGRMKGYRDALSRISSRYKVVVDRDARPETDPADAPKDLEMPYPEDNLPEAKSLDDRMKATRERQTREFEAPKFGGKGDKNVRAKLSKTLSNLKKKGISQQDEELEDIDEARMGEILKNVKKGSSPYTIVAHKNGRVVGQEHAKIAQAVPAFVREIQKKYPNAKVSVEDRRGRVLHSEEVEQKSREEMIREFIMSEIWRTPRDKYAKGAGGRGLADKEAKQQKKKKQTGAEKVIANLRARHAAAAEYNRQAKNTQIKENLAYLKDKTGNTFVVSKRKTGGKHDQDAVSMSVVDSKGKTIKNYGSHVNLKGAKKFASARGFREEVEIKEWSPPNPK